MVLPSANLYVFVSKKSASLSVPVRISVRTTSGGIVTSAAPLSSVKCKVIWLLMETGTLNVPPSNRSGTSVGRVVGTLDVGDC